MKILIVAATHGDETIGLKVIEKIKELNLSTKKVGFMIANKLAHKKGIRFIDQDLNRSFPGNQQGNYEQKLATKLLPKIKAADIVIDIHSTTSKLKDAVIVTKLDRQTFECIQIIQPKHVLIMSATKNVALISQAKVGIAFEYGKDTDSKTINKTINGIKNILIYHHIIASSHKLIPRNKVQTTFFDVYKEVPKKREQTLERTVKNYQLVEKGQVFASSEREKFIAKEDFYPILFGQNNYESIFGFAARKIMPGEIKFDNI